MNVKNVVFYNGQGIINSVRMQDDHKGLVSWSVGDKTIALKIGKEPTIKILPEAAEVLNEKGVL